MKNEKIPESYGDCFVMAFLERFEGLSQDQIADRFSVTQATVSRFVNGKSTSLLSIEQLRVGLTSKEISHLLKRADALFEKQGLIDAYRRDTRR